jgi:hypothetical protein
VFQSLNILEIGRAYPIEFVKYFESVRVPYYYLFIHHSWKVGKMVTEIHPEYLEQLPIGVIEKINNKIVCVSLVIRGRTRFGEPIVQFLGDGDGFIMY